MATGRGFSTAGMAPALLTRSVSFYDQTTADRDVWSAWWWTGPALPPITGSGAVTLDAATSAGAGTPVIVGAGAVTLDAVASAGSGSSGASSGVPARLRIGSSPRGYRGRGMSPERRR